jgi:hypothetical protein
MSSVLSWFVASAVAASGARHPCDPAPDAGDGRYVRKSVVVFPLAVEPEAVTSVGTWAGHGPTGAPIDGPAALVEQVAAGLFAVDWPLRRFDAWHTVRAPQLDGDALAATTEALRCADAAVVPRLVSADVTTEGAKVSLELALDVYQRDAEGRLTLTDHLVAAAPGLVDRVEDVMVEARRRSVDRIASALPKRAVDGAEVGGDVVLELLPDDQAAKAAAVAQEAALGLTRVASVARPATVLPTLERGAESPGVDGLRWRAEEDRCFLVPPDDESPDRLLPCAVLGRVRQAVRDLQLQTRRIEEFRLTAPVADAGTPLGEAEGVHVGDGYFLEGPDGSRAGYARVRRLGSGGLAGAAAPSRLQLVYGSRQDGLRIRENPQLGIEIGGAGGLAPASRPDGALPPDPIDGGERAIRAAAAAPAGTLRFDVNLGRTAKLYEWYQTNRVSRAFAGALRHTSAAFGLERRVQVVPRTSLLLGAGVTVGTWSVPSGQVELDEQGEPTELRAGASRIGGDLEAGLSFTVTPSILVRATAGGRLSGAITEFTWSSDERSGSVTPVGAEPFELKTGGLVAGLSTAWVF